MSKDKIRTAALRNRFLSLIFSPLTVVAYFELSVFSTRAQSLGQALDAPGLTWTTSPQNSWVYETFRTHDGVSAAMANSPSRGQRSLLQTTVTGPGTLTYWWANDSYYDRVYFSNSTTVTWIIAYPSWQQQTIYVPTGSQTEYWFFNGDDSFNINNCYLDQVNYTPGATAPIINTQPLSQSQVRGCDGLFSVGAGGTPPLHYQWQYNGGPIAGATTSALGITNLQAGNLGIYRVVITNAAGAITSSIASLEFGDLTAWGISGLGATTVPPGATNVMALAAGNQQNYALRRNGTVFAWGDNRSGQTTIPPNLSNVIAVAAGTAHGLALKADGTLVGWGGNFYGEATPPAGLTNVVAISAGDFFSVALLANGTVKAWGTSSLGVTNVPSGLSNVVAIVSRSFSTIALKADGTVATWGGGPAPPVGLSKVVAVSSGVNNFLALLGDGTITAWGQNDSGQATVPAGFSNVIAIRSGGNFNLAQLADGTIRAWGNNSYGLTNLPTGLTNAALFAAGEFHNVAAIGTNPPVRNGTFANPAFSPGTGFTASLPSTSGRVYSLQSWDGPSDSNWTSLNLTPGNGDVILLTDPSLSTTQRFYRVLQW